MSLLKDACEQLHRIVGTVKILFALRSLAEQTTWSPSILACSRATEPSRIHSTFNLLFQPSAFPLERSSRPAYFTNFLHFSADELSINSHEIKWKQLSGSENMRLLFSKKHSLRSCTRAIVLLYVGEKIWCHIFFSEIAAAVNPHKSIPQVPRQPSLILEGHTGRYFGKESLQNEVATGQNNHIDFQYNSKH